MPILEGTQCGVAIVFFNCILVEIPTKEFECLNLGYNNQFCNLIHGWIDWAMLYNKIPNTSKISAKKDFGFEGLASCTFVGLKLTQPFDTSCSTFIFT